MATSHHGPADDEHSKALMSRFIDELHGKSRREFPNGRLGADDDGATTYAIATDKKHGVIRMQFSKPTLWVGFDVEAAENLRDELNTRLLELRGITA